jgi:hypothetical protein
LGARRGGQFPQQVDRSMHSMVTISHTNRGYYILNAILNCLGIVLCNRGGLWSRSTRCASRDLHVNVDAIRTCTHRHTHTHTRTSHTSNTHKSHTHTYTHTYTHKLLLLCMCVRQHPSCANFSSVASDAHPHLSHLEASPRPELTGQFQFLLPRKDS